MESLTIIDFLTHLDQDITLFINSLSQPSTEWFWLLMSDKLTWAPAYLICGWMLFRRLGWKKALLVIASIGISFGLCDQFSNLIKDATSRLRPNYSIRMLREGLTVLEVRGGYYGFFSAHAANAFAFAMCLIIGFRNDRTHTYNAVFWWSLVWASLVAASRIFVGKHYFGDVAVGTFVGITIGYFIGMLTRYIIQRFVDKVPATGLTFKFIKNRFATIRERFSPSGSL